MKTLLISLAGVLLSVTVNAQSLIATSSSPEATANQNQRKIVRDTAGNIYVVYADIYNQENVIRGVMKTAGSGNWTNASFQISGKNPTMAISGDGRIHLLYESNDPVTKIRYTSSVDFLAWTPEVSVSDTLFSSRLPVADADSAGKVNVFWIQASNGSGESLMYAGISEETVIDRKLVTTKNSINNIVVANHLQYFFNDLFFGIQFNQDSIGFFRSVDYLASYTGIYAAKGSQPCITYNSYWTDPYPEVNFVRFLYIDPGAQLMEIESCSLDFTQCSSDVLQDGNVSYICVDDIAPPIGYSYLFMQNGILYHGFSYGNDFNWSTIMDTIAGNPILPSVAYKTFNFSYVDFIWMEDNGAGYNIYYKHDPKHIWVGMQDFEKGKGFSLTGSPNPFSEELLLTVTVDNPASVPEIAIFNSSSQLVNIPSRNCLSERKFTFRWDGRNQLGGKVDPGVYIILCTSGDKRTARKVMYMPK
jgi:hypothetical protein